MKKRIFSLLLALVMAVSLLPVSAFAADNYDLRVLTFEEDKSDTRCAAPGLSPFPKPKREVFVNARPALAVRFCFVRSARPGLAVRYFLQPGAAASRFFPSVGEGPLPSPILLKFGREGQSPSPTDAK